MLIVAPLSGIGLLLASILIIPKFYNFFRKRYKLKFSVKKRVLFAVVIIILLFFANAIFLGITDTQKQSLSNNLATTSGRPFSALTQTTNNQATTNTSNQSVNSPQTVDELKAQAINISYDELFRHNENYIGKVVHFDNAKILQVLETTSNCYEFRINVGAQYVSSIIYGTDYCGDRFLEGDLVDVYGQVTGLERYTSTQNVPITIPSIKIIQLTNLLNSNSRDSNAGLILDISNYFPNESIVPTEMVIQPIIDVNLSGTTQAKSQTFTKGTGMEKETVTATIYLFEDINKANTFYSTNVNAIKNKRGYTEITENISNCFGWDTSSFSDVQKSYCLEKNMVVYVMASSISLIGSDYTNQFNAMIIK